MHITKWPQCIIIVAHIHMSTIDYKRTGFLADFLLPGRLYILCIWQSMIERHGMHCNQSSDLAS